MISHFPEAFRSEIIAVGIDEAGRGPVLGPMVYTAAFCPLSKTESLKKDLKVADSKQLTEQSRESIFEASPQFIGWSSSILSAAYISNKMLQPCKYNLNSISHETAASLITSIQAQGYKIGHVAVDTVGDPVKYQKWLSAKFPSIGSVVVECKADSKFPIVSAASIVAKVTRDRVLRDWTFVEQQRAAELNVNLQFERNFGSGYPGDPATKDWLTKHFDKVFGFPTLIRFSWSTCQRILEKDAVQVKWGTEGTGKKRKLDQREGTFMQQKGMLN